MKKFVIIALITVAIFGQPAQAAGVMEPKTMQEFRSQVGFGKVAIFLGTMGCRHCRAFLPKFREAAAANNNTKFIFVELASPQLSDLSHEYRTQSPTLVVLKNGTEVRRVPATDLNKQSLQAAIQ
ncbi:MAG: thioredoxin family protein [Candidatus Babeliales bacterium]